MRSSHLNPPNADLPRVDFRVPLRRYRRYHAHSLPRRPLPFYNFDPAVGLFHRRCRLRLLTVHGCDGLRVIRRILADFRNGILRNSRRVVPKNRTTLSGFPVNHYALTRLDLVYDFKPTPKTTLFVLTFAILLSVIVIK